MNSSDIIRFPRERRVKVDGRYRTVEIEMPDGVRIKATESVTITETTYTAVIRNTIDGVAVPVLPATEGGER